MEHITTSDAAEFVAGCAGDRGSDDHRPSPALQPQRHLPGRRAPALVLPAGAQARDAPRGAGRRGDLGQPEVLPRHRFGAACEGRQGSGLRLRRLLHGLCRARTLCRGLRAGRRARQAGSLRQLLRCGLVRPAAQPRHGDAGQGGVDGAGELSLPTPATSSFRCAPARRWRGRWRSRAGRRFQRARRSTVVVPVRPVAALARPVAVATRCRCAGGTRRTSSDWRAEREIHPLRAAAGGRPGLRVPGVGDRRGRDAAGQLARLLQRAGLADFPA